MFASFTRNSVAFRQNGTEVANNLPRYEQGRFGQAVLVEEGTNNLLSANQASVETDLIGFVAVNSTIARDVSHFWHGVASLRITTTSTTNRDGVRTDSVAVAVSNAYSASVWARGVGSYTLRLHELTSGDVSVGATEVAIYPTTVWSRHTVSRSFGATGARARIEVVTSQQDASLGSVGVENLGNVECRIDGLQLEQKPYATSWQMVGTPRVGETLTIPSDVFNRGNWSVEGTFIPTSTMNVGGQVKRLFTLHISDSNRHILEVGAAGEMVLSVISGGVSSTVSTPANAIVQGQMYSWCISGDGTIMRLSLNGVLIGSTAYTEPVGTLPATMQIGSGGGSLWANGLIDDLRISNRARSDAEITEAFMSNHPLVADADTTTLYWFDNSLFVSIRTQLAAISRTTSRLWAQMSTRISLGAKTSTLTRLLASIRILGPRLKAPLRAYIKDSKVGIYIKDSKTGVKIL